MQYGSSHLVPAGHDVLPKLLKAGTDGHIVE